MCKEECIQAKLKDMQVIDYFKFKKKVMGKNITYKYKDIDIILYKFLTNTNVFPDYNNVKYMTFVIGGNYGKGKFTMLLTLYIEFHDQDKGTYMDEVIREIESKKDEIEIL